MTRRWQGVKKMERKRIAVIIPAYEHFASVMNCVTSLGLLRDKGSDADPLYTAIHVQDDASPSIIIPGHVPDCAATVWRNDINLGFAGNCNAGAAYVISHYDPPPDILFFVNQDVFGVPQHSKHWNIPLLEAFEDEQVGIVGARLLFPDGAIQNAGGVFDSHAQPAHRCLGWKDIEHWECATARAVDWTTGAALAIRRELFEQLGGFNPEYARGYFEDVDLCLRAREVGYQTRIEPRCTLVHKPGSTGGSPFFQQNAMRFKREWVDSGKVKAGTLSPLNRWW